MANTEIDIYNGLLVGDEKVITMLLAMLTSYIKLMFTYSYSYAEDIAIETVITMMNQAKAGKINGRTYNQLRSYAYATAYYKMCNWLQHERMNVELTNADIEKRVLPTNKNIELKDFIEKIWAKLSAEDQMLVVKLILESQDVEYGGHSNYASKLGMTHTQYRLKKSRLRKKIIKIGESLGYV